MTAKQAVSKEHPKAFAYVSPYHNAWLIYSGSGTAICGKTFGHILGQGWSRVEAWKDAAWRIEEKK